ncbi:MAG: hypothetical protein ACFFDN_51315 [Candidatus Hodarchaeota archaeon]
MEIEAKKIKIILGQTTIESSYISGTTSIELGIQIIRNPYPTNSKLIVNESTQINEY